MQSIENKVIARIYGNGRGWAFSRIDFTDLAGQSTIDWALYELEKKGTICRVIRGLYYYPIESKLLNEKLPPDIQQVAKALARKFNWQIEPSGETALNIMGISTQVPAKYVFISNGRSKEYLIGNRTLLFKKGMLRETGFKQFESKLLVQGIRALGRENITPQNKAIMRGFVKTAHRAAIKKETRSVSSWIYEVIREMCE